MNSLQNLAVLYGLLGALHLIHLANRTLLDGKWDGLAIWMSTGIFIVATIYYLRSRQAIKQDRK